MRSNARINAVRHNWLSAINAPHAIIDVAATSLHIAMQRMIAPSPIETDVR
jgi:hypothetical protein